MSTARRVPDDHPFLRNLTVSVFERRGKWVVQYRDFATVLQDPEFVDEWMARECAEDLLTRPHVVWDDELGGETYESLTKYWTDAFAQAAGGE